MQQSDCKDTTRGTAKGSTFAAPMLYLIISAAISVFMFVLFRVFPGYGVNSRQAIYLNYFVCTIIGLLFQPSDLEKFTKPETWWVPAGIVGILFVVTFVVLSTAVQKVGITVATVSAKLGMVIPVLLNLYVLKTATAFGLSNWVGMVLALASVILVTMPVSTPGLEQPKLTLAQYRYPIQVFIQAGLADSLISATNALYNPDQAFFTSYVYASCAVVSAGFLVIELVKGEKLSRRTLIGAIVLGVPNYFSLYAMVRGLQELNNNGAVAVPFLNILTLVGAALVGLLAFKDKFAAPNYLGLVSAAAAILLLSLPAIF